MSFLSDYFTALSIWKGLTRAQQRQLKFPWHQDSSPRTINALTAKGLWDEHGPTRTGLAVTLCHFIGGGKPPNP